MTPDKRVLVGMSGGIDSTATCLMLQEQGYEVVGLTMWVWGDEPAEAVALAREMGVEHHVADEREGFRDTIVRYFIDEYRSGRTPNPCVMCNPLFKFRLLEEWADRLGCAHISTGHYIRLEERGGRVYICVGDDEKKDQSYFLWRLGQDMLRRCVFPLGGYTKPQVRDYLRAKGYAVKADDGESMEVCFIKGDYRDFLREKAEMFHSKGIRPEGVFVRQGASTVPASEAAILDMIKETSGDSYEAARSLGLSLAGKDVFTPLGEFSQNLVAEKMGLPVHKGVSLDEAIPPRPPVMCAGCPHRGLFYTLNKNKCTVMGDIGCYTLGAVAPLAAMDMTLCMGGSISGLHGFNKARGAESEHKTVAVIGDSTFMHSGMTGLANIAYNQSNSTVIILDNSITGMTGHQQNPTTGYNIKGDPAGKIDLESLCRAMGFKRVRVVDPYNLKECDQAVKEELAADEPSVIISRRPCALLKYVKHNPPLVVNKDKCIGCKSCMKIGCPAVSIKEGKAHVDNTLCVGCGVCEQLCPVGAFESTGKEG